MFFCLIETVVVFVFFRMDANRQQVEVLLFVREDCEYSLKALRIGEENFDIWRG